MELALPRFGSFEDRSAPARKSWPVSTDSPASPGPDGSPYLVRSPSLCLNLDTLSSDGYTTVGSDQVLSDVNLPSGSPSEDRRQVLRTQDISPEDWSIRQSVSMCRLADGSDGQMPPSAGAQDLVPAVRP